MIATHFRLRKHAEYQSVYKASRKQFSKQMSYFFTLRSGLGPDGTPVHGSGAAATSRIGLTVGKVLGKAVDRNRIKRRMREAVRRHLNLLRTPVDVILHPRRTVLDLDFPLLEREIATIFRLIQRSASSSKSAEMQRPSQPPNPRHLSS